MCMHAMDFQSEDEHTETVTEQLDAIDGMQVIEHEGRRLRVITSALHDQLCTWRVATPQGTEPEVLGCAGCGFCYPPVTDVRDDHSETAVRKVQCRYLRRNNRQCTAEVADDDSDILLCTKHVARVMLLLSVRGFKVTPPEAPR
jgi:hypothetical protein